MITGTFFLDQSKIKLQGSKFVTFTFCKCKIQFPENDLEVHLIEILKLKLDWHSDYKMKMDKKIQDRFFGKFKQVYRANSSTRLAANLLTWKKGSCLMNTSGYFQAREIEPWQASILSKQLHCRCYFWKKKNNLSKNENADHLRMTRRRQRVVRRGTAVTLPAALKVRIGGPFAHGRGFDRRSGRRIVHVSARCHVSCPSSTGRRHGGAGSGQPVHGGRITQRVGPCDHRRLAVVQRGGRLERFGGHMVGGHFPARIV